MLLTILLIRQFSWSVVLDRHLNQLLLRSVLLSRLSHLSTCTHSAAPSCYPSHSDDKLLLLSRGPLCLPHLTAAMPAQISKVALVTGCSEPESLGAALALNLLGRGYKVYATARKLESMKQLEGKGCEVSGAHGSCSWAGTTEAGTVDGGCRSLPLMCSTRPRSSPRRR
jgi:hypothetical protein